MSNSENSSDMDRYFNDPAYRRKKIDQRKKNTKKAASLSRIDRMKQWYADQSAFIKYGIATMGVLALLIIGYIIYLYQGLPSIQALENPQTAIASLVKSRDGVILDKYYIENRTNVPLEQISPHVVNALIATEDHRFYEHWGIDMQGIFAAIFQIVTTGDVRGASTITQQLARNLYKKIGRDFSLTRKFREMITAIDIEQHYTKREILEMYLNTVQYANSAFGIEAAAYTHYGKDADELNILESAMMIGCLKAIYKYNPRLFPERSQHRRNVVLAQMNKRGFISDSTFARLTEKPIALNYHPPSTAGPSSRYFGQYIRKQIEPWAKENGYNLNTDGLIIHTTINSRYQKYAQQAVEEKLDSLQVIFEDEWTSSGGSYMNLLWERYPGFLKSFIKETDRYKNGFAKYNTDQQSVVFDSLFADEAFIDSVKHVNTRLQAGFVAIDPTNGHIRAWVGGRDYGKVQFDHVYQAHRQAGSTFKPFVYTVAVANGYMPYHKFSKYPSTFYGPNGKVWDPKSFSMPEGPAMLPLRQGLARSLNNVTVNLLATLSGTPNTTRIADLKPAARKIKQMAMNFGIDLSDTPAYPSIALGTAKVSLLELASAYTVFANQGVHIEPVAITHIEDKHGNIVKKFNPSYRKEVISPETAYIMIDMMRGVIRGGDGWYGTGVRLQYKYNMQQDVAGKTGTTQNAADNWFMAVTPHLVMGAWVGGQDRRVRWPTYSNTGQGAHTALPIVGRFINLTTSDPEAPWSYEAFKAPPGFEMPQPPDQDFYQGTQQNQRIDW